jgi:transporter family protein
MSVSPLTFAVVAMLAWGLWSVFATLATRTIVPEVAMVVSYVVGAGLATVYVLGRRGTSIELTQQGLAWSGAAGVASGVAAVAFYAGLHRGETGVVTTVSALYFVVAAVLGVLVLDDTMGTRELVGVAFAIAAVVMLAD